METNVFKPVVGKLCSRVSVSDFAHEILYCYRDDKNDPNHFKTICRMSRFVVKPYDYGFISTDMEIGTIAGNPHEPSVIHWHICTWDEIQAIKNLWQKPDPSKSDNNYIDFDQWITGILTSDILSQDTAERLRKLSP